MIYQEEARNLWGKLSWTSWKSCGWEWGHKGIDKPTINSSLKRLPSALCQNHTQSLKGEQPMISRFQELEPGAANILWCGRNDRRWHRSGRVLLRQLQLLLQRISNNNQSIPYANQPIHTNLPCLCMWVSHTLVAWDLVRRNNWGVTSTIK